jgi:hypothetical protein
MNAARASKAPRPHNTRITCEAPSLALASSGASGCSAAPEWTQLLNSLTRCRTLGAEDARLAAVESGADAAGTVGAERLPPATAPKGCSRVRPGAKAFRRTVGGGCRSIRIEAACIAVLRDQGREVGAKERRGRGWIAVDALRGCRKAGKGTVATESGGLVCCLGADKVAEVVDDHGLILPDESLARGAAWPPSVHGKNDDCANTEAPHHFVPLGLPNTRISCEGGASRPCSGADLVSCIRLLGGTLLPGRAAGLVIYTIGYTQHSNGDGEYPREECPCL